MVARSGDHVWMDIPPGRQLPDHPRLEIGEGLVLRRHQPADLVAIFEQCNDPEMQRWTTVPVPYEMSDAEQFLEHVRSAWEHGTEVALAIEALGRFAGTVSYRLQEGDWAEIGYGLSPWARGHQVMTRAVSAFLDWGFRDLGLVRVEWRAVVGNHASRRVAEKCGFRVEGTVRGLLMHRGQRLDGWIGTRLSTDTITR